MTEQKSSAMVDRLVFNALGNGVVVQSRDGAIIRVNPAAERILGLSAYELTGRTSVDPRWRIVDEHGVDLPGDQHPAMVALATRKPVRGFVMGVARPDDGLTWILVNAELVHNPDGTLEGSVVTTFTDISEQIALRRQLADAKSRYQLLAEGASDIVMRLSTVGVIEWVSPSFTSVLGWDCSQWLGRDPIDVLHEDDREMVRTLRRELGDGLRLEFRARAQTSSASYRWIEVRAKKIIDDDGTWTGVVSSWRDIDEQVRAEHESRDALEHYRLLAENSSDVVFRADNDGVALWISQSVSDVLGWSTSEWIGRNFREFVLDEDIAGMVAVQERLTLGEKVHFRVRLRTKDSNYRWMDVTTSPITDTDGRIIGRSGAWRDVQSQVEAEEKLNALAHRDAATGLLSRSATFEQFNRVMRHHDRTGTRVAVLYVDIDRFKSVNDARGHRAGDAVLETVGRRIEDEVRRDDLVGRIGGDEMLIVAKGVHDLAEAAGVAEKIRVAASLPIAYGDGEISVTLSIGVTLVEDGEGLDTVVARADDAMYEAKSQGRDRVVAR